ncbi:DUF2194 domain-containing protein [Maribacter sp. SA7]|uniref:DUF2194 domain-containing protein n=1 Tax=Maribacter zhoushanensis TaxID=3030012 RepID=UPI0023ED2FD4|nr:DUF2194 domain-containing protein [Maribacter zhoushanensis]MDF4203964.1 DUF2194 domain-containing protein [Maribacter zhoushanensis]
MTVKKLGYLSLLIALSLMTGCQQELYKSNNKFNIPEKSTEEPLVQFLIEPTNYSAIIETENLAKAFDYSKIAHKTLWVNQFNEKLNISSTTRVVTVHETAGLSTIAVDSLLKFVSKGGTLLVTKANKDERMSYFFGMTPDADWSTNKEASGLFFNKALFPGMQGRGFDNETVHLGFNGANFSSSVNVLVAAYNNEDYPVLIENRIGNGKVILYNSSQILKKEMRGLLFSASLLGLEGIPYPIANIGTLFLDDFPSSMYDENGKAINIQNGISKSEMLKADWWPKMKAFAQEEDIKYSAYVTFNANEKNTGDANFKSWDQTGLLDGTNENGTNKWITNEFTNRGHELGFRGYNDLPLSKKLWKDTDLILDNAKASREKWEDNVSKTLPSSYVAPDNQIDSLGLISLKKGFPSLSFLHTSFLGDVYEGGNREFDPDPLNNRFFDYPRLSSGYSISEKEQWAIESTYLYTGIWSHVLNTKDILEIGSTTNAIGELKKHIVDYKKRHPYMKFLTAKQSTEAAMDWRYQSIRHLSYEGQYEVSSSLNSDEKKESYWLMYVEERNNVKVHEALSFDQAEFSSVPLLNGFLYSIQTKSPNISVPDIRPEINTLIGTTSSLITNTKSDYKSYNQSKQTMVPLKQKIDRLIVEEKTEEATNLMEKLFKDNKFINTQQIVSYAEGMEAQGKTDELWSQLNSLYLKNPSSSYADFSRDISTVSNYPSPTIKKMWMERQMEWGQNDVTILKEYYENFNTEDNTEIVEQVLEVLQTIEPTTENKLNYYKFLVNSNNEDLIKKLDDIEPCSIFNRDLATSISQVYADKLNFERAEQWQKCGNISPEIVKEWKEKTRTIESKKFTDFEYYIRYLLINDQDKAVEELRDIETCRPDLIRLSKNIAFLFADYTQYQKALDWSTCTNTVPVAKLLDWNLEFANGRYLTKVYANHIDNNPRDYNTMNHMVKLLLKGDVNGAGEIAMKIPPSKIDPDFKIAFNNEVKATSEEKQSLYISKFKTLMDDAIVKKSEIESRKEKGHSIGLTSSAIADEFNPTLFNNAFHFGFYNKELDFHQFSIVQGTAYSVLKDTIVPNDIGRDLLGVEYLYKKESNQKNPFYVGARVELDNFNKVFFHFTSGIDFMGDNSKSSLGIKAHPVTTGPGYDLNIYDIQVKAAQEFEYSSNLNHEFYVKADYYTDSQYYAIGGTRVEYNVLNLDKFKLGPLIEGAYGVGSEDRRNGFPYWLTKDRLFAGGGLQFQLGNEDSAFNLKSDFSLFAEQDEDSFQRYEGELSYRIKNFTTINLNYSYYTIDQFFSNAVQLGIQYNFK